MNPPESAQLFSDMATFLIGLGTLGCLIWPPRFVGNLLNLRVAGPRRNRSRAFATMLLTGIVFSVIAIVLRVDATYALMVAGAAVGLGLFLMLQVLLSNVFDGAAWWAVHGVRAKRERSGDREDPVSEEAP